MSCEENILTVSRSIMDYSRKRWFTLAFRFLRYAFQCFPLKKRYGRRDFWQMKEFLADAKDCFWWGVIGRKELLLFALLAFSQVGFSQDFSFRTLAAFDGHQSPKWGGTVEFVKRQALFDVVGSFTTRRLPDGTFFQTVELGGQKIIYKLDLANIFACGNVGYEGANDNAGYLAGGCFGFESKPLWKELRLVGKWKGTQESLRDTTWQGNFGFQYNFKGK